MNVDKFQNINGCIAASLLGVATIVAGSDAASAQARAQEVEHTLSFTAGVEHRPLLVERDEPLTYVLETAPYLAAQYSAVKRLAGGARLLFDADAEFTGIGVDDAERLGLGLSLAYQRNFGEGNANQIRVTGFVDSSHDEDGVIFNRERLALRFQRRHSPEQATSVQVRVGDRDQNEATFFGFDQSEFLGSVTHTWRPNNDRRALAGTVYAEGRRAEFDQFSYDEIGLRVLYRVPLENDIEVTSRLTYFQRDFEGSFSPTDPTIREDIRLRASVDIERAFSEQFSVHFGVGWEDNSSTIASRRFSGSRVDLGITYEFN